MKVLSFANRQNWLAARVGKITGTRVKDLIVKRGNGKKIGYYQMIAEKLAVDDGINMLDPMERGTYLEEEAINRFMEESGLKVDTSLQLWVRDDDENIAISPDGSINDGQFAVEVKCIASARHIETYLMQEVPGMYYDQVLQYFIVNDKLEKLYFVCFDPRLIVAEFFWLEVNREDVQAKVEQYLEYERTTLEDINDIVAQLTKF